LTVELLGDIFRNSVEPGSLYLDADTRERGDAIELVPGERVYPPDDAHRKRGSRQKRSAVSV